MGFQAGVSTSHIMPVRSRMSQLLAGIEQCGYPKKMPGPILVVDDEPFQVLFMQKALAGFGYDVLTAASGREALEKVRSVPVGLVLTDLSMPDLDGIGLTGALRASGFCAGILVVTALKSQNQISEGYKAGADGFVLKPVALDVLEIVVRRELQRQELIEENKRLKSEREKK